MKKPIPFLSLAVLILATLCVSCKKEKAQPAPAAPTSYDNTWGPSSGTDAKVTFVPVTADPYNGAAIVGGVSNIYVIKAIASDYTFQGYGIYVNRANASIYATDTTNVYYNPTALSYTVHFGTSAPAANIVEFCQSVNAGIAKNGYAVISVFMDGGPAGETWKIVL